MQTTRLTSIVNDMSELIGSDTYGVPKVRRGLERSHRPQAREREPDGLGQGPLGIIREAEKDGLITPGKSVLIEATSGNSPRTRWDRPQYRVILVMPDQMSQEQRCLLKILGAEVILTPAA